MADISVIIPVYNRSDTLPHAVASVHAQSLPAREIIIVDDGSSPPVDPNVFSHPRIRILRQSVNVGAAAARQAGIEAASGEFVAFLDSDDVWAPDKLARQACLLTAESDPLVAVACGWSETDAAGRKRRTRIPKPSSDLGDFVSGIWFCPGSTLLISSAALKRVGPFDSSLSRLEDLDWFIRFALAGGRLAVAPIALVTIARGRNARIAPVRVAASQIAQTARDEWRLSPKHMRSLQAYLELEIAAACRNEAKPLAMVGHLLASFVRRPRASVALRNWWT